MKIEQQQKKDCTVSLWCSLASPAKFNFNWPFSFRLVPGITIFLLPQLLARGWQAPSRYTRLSNLTARPPCVSRKIFQWGCTCRVIPIGSGDGRRHTHRPRTPSSPAPGQRPAICGDGLSPPRTRLRPCEKLSGSPRQPPPVCRWQTA